MQQRDIIKDQIDQLGKVLSKLLNGFIESNETFEEISNINEQLKKEVDLDIDTVIDLNFDELKSYLPNIMNESHLELLSQYLYKAGIVLIESNLDLSKKYLFKSIDCLDLAGIVSQTMSIDRLNKTNKIKELIISTYPRNKI